MKVLKTSPTNPNNSSMKTKLASRFLRAMKKVLTTKKTTSSSVADKYKRYHAIRAAAYASMAAAVGPRKAWSRAILGKIKNHRRSLLHHRGHNRVVVARRNPRNDDFNLGFGDDQEDNLRGLVPGGESMDFSKLLNETGHYIKCLRAQVQLMRKIVDFSASR